jgi:preprotein translocase subunit SecA
MREQSIDDLVKRSIPEHAYAEQWDMGGLHTEVLRIFNLDLPLAAWAKEEGIAEDEIHRRITDAVARKMAEKAANYGPELMRYAEKSLLLQILDTTWKEHLLALDHLRQGISLRAYAQRDPLNEYKSEAFTLFEDMLVRLREAVTRTLAHLELRFREPTPEPEPQAQPRAGELMRAAADGGQRGQARSDAGQRLRPRAVGMAVDAADPSTWGKVARNSPCPCGSGKKYKQCHGKLGAGAAAAK